MKRPETLIERQFEKIFETCPAPAKLLDGFVPPLEEMKSSIIGILERMRVKCNDLNLSNDVGEDHIEVAYSSEMRLNVKLHYGLMASFIFGDDVLWKKTVELQQDPEDLYKELEELVCAGMDPSFLEELKGLVHNFQREKMVMDMKAGNVRALADEVLTGLNYRLEYRKYYTAVIVRLDKRREVEFRVPYKKAAEMMNKIPSWASSLSAALASVDAEVAMMPGERNYTWEE